MDPARPIGIGPQRGKPNQQRQWRATELILRPEGDGMAERLLGQGNVVVTFSCEESKS